jgi:hypothetical protein
MLYRVVTFVFFSFFSHSIFATSFPRGCETNGFVFNHNFLILNPNGKQSFYLIENRTKETIRIQRHETRDVFMSPKLITNLNSSDWAAFASDEDHTYFKCAIKENDSKVAVNCNDVLEVCQYPRARFALSNMGTYWVSTNKPLDMVVKEAVGKGIYLKW